MALILDFFHALGGVIQGWGGKRSYFIASCVNISRTVGVTSKVTNNEEVYSPRRQQYKHYNDNEHAKTDMYIEHCIKY